MRILFSLFAVFSFSQSLFCQQRDDHQMLEENQVVSRIIESGFLSNSKEILDLGCGDGELTAAFAANLPQALILGGDVSKAMIEVALQQHAASNLRFVEMDAEKLDFKNQFDAVVSVNCLHFVDNQKRAIEQIYHALKPGGKAFLIATPESSNNDIKKICRSIILSCRWLPHFVGFRSTHSFLSKKEYRETLKKTGFLVDKAELKQAEWVFKDRSELEAFLNEVLTPLQHLAASKRPAFLRDFFKEIKKRGKIDANGTIHLFYDQIELAVTKGHD